MNIRKIFAGFNNADKNGRVRFLAVVGMLMKEARRRWCCVMLRAVGKNTNGTNCKTLRVDIHPDSRIRLGINLRFFCVGKFLRQFAALKKALSECFMYYEIWPKLRIFICCAKGSKAFL